MISPRHKVNVNSSNSPSCSICRNQVFPKFSAPCDYRKPNIPKDYEIYWCPECDYGLVWERPSKEEIACYYVLDDYYTHDVTTARANNKEAAFLDRLRVHIAWRMDAGEELTPREVIPLLEENNPTMCEIGCGNAGNLAAFQAAGFSVFGVEPDPAAREVAKRVTGNIFDGTGEELPDAITNRKYDVVLMSHVLEHCLDIHAAVTNAQSILKEGGIYIVETPNCQSLGFRSYGGEWPMSDIPRHLNFFTPDSLKNLLKSHGFDVNGIKYHGFCRQFSNAWLRNEEEIWTAFSRYGANKKDRPDFRSRAWKLLLRSVFASKASKYDSVRLLGVKDGKA